MQRRTVTERIRIALDDDVDERHLAAVAGDDDEGEALAFIGSAEGGVVGDQGQGAGRAVDQLARGGADVDRAEAGAPHRQGRLGAVVFRRLGGSLGGLLELRDADVQGLAFGGGRDQGGAAVIAVDDGQCLFMPDPGVAKHLVACQNSQGFWKCLTVDELDDLGGDLLESIRRANDLQNACVLGSHT